MTISKIYEWLLENDPSEDDPNIRQTWANLASYCYFVNVLDFDNEVSGKLKEVLVKSDKYNIKVPDRNHKRTIEFAKGLNGKNTDLKALVHEHR